MRYYYAATHLNERFANSGKTARKIHAFASRAVSGGQVRCGTTRPTIARRCGHVI